MCFYWSSITKTITATVSYYVRAFGAVSHGYPCTDVSETKIWPLEQTLWEHSKCGVLTEDMRKFRFPSHTTSKVDKMHEGSCSDGWSPRSRIMSKTVFKSKAKDKKKGKEIKNNPSVLKLSFRPFSWHIHIQHNRASHVVFKTIGNCVQMPDARVQHFVVAHNHNIEHQMRNESYVTVKVKLFRAQNCTEKKPYS